VRGLRLPTFQDVSMKAKTRQRQRRVSLFAGSVKCSTDNEPTSTFQTATTRTSREPLLPARFSNTSGLRGSGCFIRFIAV